MDKANLMLLSQILILIAVALIGSLPFIERHIIRKSDRQSALQQKYYEIRRSIDNATTIWEQSRIFFSQQSIMVALGVDMKKIQQNWGNYRYCISAAETFAFNAAYGFTETQSERETSKEESNRRNRPENRTVEKIREAYLVYQKRAISRCDLIIQEIRAIETYTSTAQLWKTCVIVIGLLLNIVGLGIGIRISMR